MLRHTCVCLRNFRLAIKYPALVSYNKLPWETLAPDSPSLHRHVAPFYTHVMQLAASAFIPRLVLGSHIETESSRRMQLLPGKLYLLRGDEAPRGFTPHLVQEPESLQHYGPLVSAVGSLASVKLHTSDDLQLLCLQLTFTSPLSIAHQPGSSIATAGALKGTESPGEEPPWSLYHFFRPNRSPTEVTQPLERLLRHTLYTAPIICSSSATSSPQQEADWVPVLQAPARCKSTKATMAPYRPPQSYLMGLAERLAVRPGNCFGRRSLMWGHWF